MEGVMKERGPFEITPHKVSICILIHLHSPPALMSVPFPFSSVSQHNRFALFLLAVTKVRNSTQFDQSAICSAFYFTIFYFKISHLFLIYSLVMIFWSRSLMIWSTRWEKLAMFCIHGWLISYLVDSQVFCRLMICLICLPNCEVSLSLVSCVILFVSWIFSADFYMYFRHS